MGMQLRIHAVHGDDAHMRICASRCACKNLDAHQPHQPYVGICKRNLSSSPESDASIDRNIQFSTVIQIFFMFYASYIGQLGLWAQRIGETKLKCHGKIFFALYAKMCI